MSPGRPVGRLASSVRSRMCGPSVMLWCSRAFVRCWESVENFSGKVMSAEFVPLRGGDGSRGSGYDVSRCLGKDPARAAVPKRKAGDLVDSCQGSRW